MPSLGQSQVGGQRSRVVGFPERGETPGGEHHGITVGEPAGRVGAHLREVMRAGPEVRRDRREVGADLPQSLPDGGVGARIPVGEREAEARAAVMREGGELAPLGCGQREELVHRGERPDARLGDRP